MATEETEIVVGERKFFLRPLRVKKQIRASVLIMPMILDVVRAMRTDVNAGLASLDGLSELVDIFAERCTVEFGSPKPIALTPVIDNVFARSPSALLVWLAECVHIELGDFLGENGQNLFKGLAARFGYQTGSTGESGE